jgi:hypothetical protein
MGDTLGIIKEKIKIIGKTEKEVIAEIDTGSDRTVIEENELRDIGLEPIGTIYAIYGGGEMRKENTYLVKMQIKNCPVFDIVVAGGKKNLVGNDILQVARATIDEKTHSVIFEKCPSTIQIIGREEMGDMIARI